MSKFLNSLRKITAKGVAAIGILLSAPFVMTADFLYPGGMEALAEDEKEKALEEKEKCWICGQELP